jgi:hypothetical protein
MDITRWNQMDHVMIDKRHSSDTVNVRRCRGAVCGSDHFLVRIGYKQKFSRKTGKQRENRVRYEIQKFKEEEVMEKYRIEVERRLESEPFEDVQEEWGNIKEMLISAAKKIIGKKEKKEREEWFDEECKQVINEQNKIRQKMSKRYTRSIREEYKEKRKTAKKICRKKKREYEERQLETLEEYVNKGETRKICKEVRERKTGFQPRVDFYRDKEIC